MRLETMNIWNITPNLHTNSHFEMWVETWTISPVKIWQDPPQIATKTKWPPSCRKLCVDFKNEKFTKINWEKILNKIAIYIIFTIMKIVSFFTTNLVYICFHTRYMIMRIAGWLIIKLLEELHINMQIQGKIFFISSYFTTVFSS